MFKPLENLINNYRNSLLEEWELLKLKVLRVVSHFLASAFALIFLIIFFNITLVLGGLWLGFLLSEILGSFMAGFGASALIFVLILAVLVIFQGPLLVRPFQNAIIRVYDLIYAYQAKQDDSGKHKKPRRDEK